jgi:hypothetical protein
MQQSYGKFGKPNTERGSLHESAPIMISKRHQYSQTSTVNQKGAKMPVGPKTPENRHYNNRKRCHSASFATDFQTPFQWPQLDPPTMVADPTDIRVQYTFADIAILAPAPRVVAPMLTISPRSARPRVPERFPHRNARQPPVLPLQEHIRTTPLLFAKNTENHP